jgi:hypothetical protein
MQRSGGLYPENIQHKKRAGGMAQVVECLPTKHETMSQTPVPKKKKKKEVQNSRKGIYSRLRGLENGFQYW